VVMGLWGILATLFRHRPTPRWPVRKPAWCSMWVFFIWVPPWSVTPWKPEAP